MKVSRSLPPWVLLLLFSPFQMDSSVFQALLQRTLEEVPDTGGEGQETFGVFHEALRPLAHRCVGRT